MKSVLAALAGLVSICTIVSSCSPQKVDRDVVQTPPTSDTITLTPTAVERFGLSVVTVEQKPEVGTITTTGEIKADENRVFHINSLSSGRLIRDNVVLGDVIRPGQTLGVVQNLDVAKVYGDYIHRMHENEIDIHLSETRLALAKKNFERLKGLYLEKIVAEKDYLKAQSDKELEEETLRGLREHSRHIEEEARAMLGAYGVKLTDRHPLRIESNSPITSPRGGVIIKKTVTVGDVVSSSEPLYVVGDLSHVWLDIAVYDTQLQSIKEGDKVTFLSDSLPGRPITSRITYIKPATQEGGGTFVARAILDNPRLDLKPGMLGQVVVEQLHSSTLPFVPEEALQAYANEKFVFIVESPRVYRKQLVTPAKKVEGGYLIAAGLTPGQRIVGKGSFTLKAEMLKSSMGGED